jgi:hypothetical protein
MSFPNLNIATIPNGQATSSVINKGNTSVSTVHVLRSNSANAITVQGSFNNSTFFNVIVNISASATPNQVFSLPTGASGYIVSFPSWILDKIPFIRFSSAANITDAAGCEIRLY